jgi:hypothetical protein
MLLRVPVLAYSATAVPHTLGSAGVRFEEKDTLAEVGEMAHLLARPGPLREAVLKEQDQRLAALAPAAVEAALAGYLESL